MNSVVPRPRSEFLQEVDRLSGQRMMRCYQCGKCAAGCPSAYVMDLTPRQIVRAVQLGMRDEALTSTSIWLCLSCQTCSARCPLDIDIAKVMETLRLMAVAEGKRPGERNVDIFHRVFLEVVQRMGRVYEAGLAGAYNLVSGQLLANVNLLPEMLAKGRLAVVPHRARGTKEVQEIFARVKAREARKP